MRRLLILSLNLRSSTREKIDVKRILVRRVGARPSIRPQDGRHVGRVRGVGIRWRNIGRADLRGRCGLGHCRARRRHHECRRLFVGTVAHRGHVVVLVGPSRVWVTVNPRVPSQFVRPAESLCAARILTGVWLLPRVRPNVPRLML